MLATLTHGEGFSIKTASSWLLSVSSPGGKRRPQRFGIWALDATLYAVPEIPSFMSTTTNRNVRLSFASDDALVRWRIETEGWVVTLVGKEGA